MNGIEKITRLIQSDAQAEIDGILDRAKAEAAQIRASYDNQIEKERAEFQLKNEKAAAERRERLESVAHMEARKIALSAKQDEVDKVYALALEKLCSLPYSQYVEVLCGLIAKAAPDGQGELVFNERDREAIGQRTLDAVNGGMGMHLTLSPETAPIKGGFILRKGKVEVNCAFETLIRLQKPETAGHVAEILFN